VASALLIEGGKWTEIIASQPVVNLRHSFLHYKPVEKITIDACSFSQFCYLQSRSLLFSSLLLTIAIYRLQVTTFFTLGAIIVESNAGF
jgi:hypothetical protein